LNSGKLNNNKRNSINHSFGNAILLVRMIKIKKFLNNNKKVMYTCYNLTMALLSYGESINYITKDDMFYA